MPVASPLFVGGLPILPARFVHTDFTFLFALASVAVRDAHLCVWCSKSAARFSLAVPRDTDRFCELPVPTIPCDATREWSVNTWEPLPCQRGNIKYSQQPVRLGTAQYLIIPSSRTHLGLAIGLKNHTARGTQQGRQNHPTGSPNVGRMTIAGYGDQVWPEGRDHS